MSAVPPADHELRLSREFHAFKYTDLSYPEYLNMVTSLITVSLICIRFRSSYHFTNRIVTENNEYLKIVDKG